MDKDRSDAVRQRILETHRLRRRAEIDALRTELREIKRMAYLLIDRLTITAGRLRAQEDAVGQEETTIALPVLSNKKGPGSAC